MKLALVSDFRSYYDFGFDYRWSKSGYDKYKDMYLTTNPDLKFLFRLETDETYSRLQMFRLFENNFIKVPKYGIYSIKRDSLSLNDGIPIITKEDSKSKKLVIYLNGYSHCGENKELLDYDNNIYSGKYFCSEYIDTEPGVSYRDLCFGNINISLKYKSTKDWRSNVSVLNSGEDQSIELIKIDCVRKHPKIIEPFYAIDYVKDNKDNLLGIDFNTAPGCPNWLQDYVTPKEIYDSIKNFLESKKP